LLVEGHSLVPLEEEVLHPLLSEVSKFVWFFHHHASGRRGGREGKK